jgi:hypothetical protein
MAKAPDKPADTDTGAAARDFFTAQALFSNPQLAFLYTDLLVHSPTTVTAARERTETERSTAYKYANELAELGVAAETGDREDGAALWRAEPVVGTWHGAAAFTLSPTVIAVYGASSRDDDLGLFCDRHGTSALAPAVAETLAYCRGEQTRRGVADALGVPAAEGIAVSQAIESVVAVLAGVDPTLDPDTFEIEVHDRAIADSPYTPADE